MIARILVASIVPLTFFFALWKTTQCEKKLMREPEAASISGTTPCPPRWKA